MINLVSNTSLLCPISMFDVVILLGANFDYKRPKFAGGTLRFKVPYKGEDQNLSVLIFSTGRLNLVGMPSLESTRYMTQLARTCMKSLGFKPKLLGLNTVNEVFRLRLKFSVDIERLSERPEAVYNKDIFIGLALNIRAEDIPLKGDNRIITIKVFESKHSSIIIMGTRDKEEQNTTLKYIFPLLYEYRKK